ncbi:MAG: tetratricopeptide repeat protein [Anaerolineae bacterium]
MDRIYPIITTKVRIPRRRPSVLRRERLIDYIHANIHRKLILISAAAGYGKTSLLIDYAHDTDLPVCWYSLDANDRHAPTFVEYLVQAIRQRFPSFGDEVLQALQDYNGPAEEVEPFVRLLIQEIERHTDRYFVIVLDDYHEVIEYEPINALVDGLLRYLPENCHILLASRGIPRRLTLTRLAARQEVAGLGVEHLRFTPDEIRELLATMGRADLTPDQVDTLAERTEGWITGILLAAQTNWTGALHDILQVSGASGGVFDYMAEEIMGRQPDETQRFLMGSALFREMTPPLCDALLEINNSAQLLRELSEQNLFTMPLDAEGTWYQYHQLFREFLVSKLEQDEPDQHRRLCIRQAEIMSHQGRWDSAVESYLSARVYDQAADTIEVVAPDIFDSGRREVLRGWIDALPAAELAQHPRLLLFRGKIYTESGEMNQATALLARAHESYLTLGDRLGAARALVQSAVVQRLRGRLSEAISICQAALEMAAGRDPLVAILAHYNLGICQNMRGNAAEGMGELQTALRLAKEQGDDINAAFAAHDMGTAELWQGELVHARQYYHQALMYWRKVGNASALAATLQDLGVVHHYLGQYTEAENRLQEGLAKARLAHDARIEVYALASQGDLYRDTVRYGEAVTCYRQAMELASGAQLTNLMIYLLDALGNTYRLQGDLAQAGQTITEVMDQVHESEMEYEGGIARLSLGVLELARGQREDAAAHLHIAADVFARIGPKRDLGRTYLHLAELARAQEDAEQLGTSLREVARIATELGTFQFVVGEGVPIEPLLAFAEKQRLTGIDFARWRSELVRFTPGAAASPAGDGDQTAPTVEFLAINHGQVYHRGARVTEWESAAAHHLAFLFLAHPDGLRRDKVIDMLWPEVSPSKGNSLFHSSMYRLRSALGKDIVVHDKGSYRINPAGNLRYDVHEFMCLAGLGRGKDEDAHQARAQAILLYRSPFLETCEDEWAFQLRESLQQELVDLLLVEARYWAERGELHQAETHYARVLALDSYDERAHRGIMWCRASNNDRPGALRQYRECRRILNEELAVEPGPETRTLHDAITAGKPYPLPD